MVKEKSIQEAITLRSLVKKNLLIFFFFFTYFTHFKILSLSPIQNIMASQAKKRKMNFSEREVEIIVEEMEKQKHILVNHYNAGVTHIAKNNAWMDILKRVNAVTNCQRELAEVKKKWSDLKTEVRRKVAQARAAIEDTGDCTTVPVILTAMQQRICNLLGEATIISLPAGESGEQSAEIAVPVSVPISTATTTVTLTQSKSMALLQRGLALITVNDPQNNGGKRHHNPTQ